MISWMTSPVVVALSGVSSDRSNFRWRCQTRKLLNFRCDEPNLIKLASCRTSQQRSVVAFRFPFWQTRVVDMILEIYWTSCTVHNADKGEIEMVSIIDVMSHVMPLRVRVVDCRL